MPAPTPERLYAFLDELIAEKVTDDNRHPVFEWEYLLTQGFRSFKSTSNAVRSRMEKLLEDERLARVEVSANGYVHLPIKEFQTSLFSVYFQYHRPYEYARENYGYVTHVRSKGHDNVWRSGVRYLYTTRDRYGELVMDLLDAKRKEDAAKAEKRKTEKRRMSEALNKVAPDAEELLRRLRDLNKDNEVSVRSRVWNDEDGLNATINLYSTEGISLFLDILRRGLPDVPRETSTDQGEK
jgi:uncharacterized protein YggL (DUF469 family)